MRCSTHHNGCTCREAYFELVTQERNDNVKWSAELRAQVQTLKQESSFWMGQTAIYKNALAQRTPDTTALLTKAGTEIRRRYTELHEDYSKSFFDERPINHCVAVEARLGAYREVLELLTPESAEKDHKV